jgi:hypothetical protein
MFAEMNIKMIVTVLGARAHPLFLPLFLFSNLYVDQCINYSYTYGI